MKLIFSAVRWDTGSPIAIKTPADNVCRSLAEALCWGVCSPTMCDWGEVALKRITPLDEGAFDGWFASWDFEFKTTYIWVQVIDQRLKVESMDIFSNHDGRPPYSVLSWMHWMTPQPLTASRSETDGLVRLQLEPASSFKLQRCTDLNCADWEDVPLPQGTTEYVVSGDAKQGFFRLVKE